MDLDIVYTFVDNTDKKWANKVKKYSNTISEGRFNFQGEIYFSLKTLEKFFPHIRKIFIVSDNQKFNLNFLSNNFAKKIKFIDHKEIIPEKYLPTFNSLIIETFLWKIPELNDNFIYFNDDILVGNYISDCDYFTNERKLKVFIKKRKVEKSEKLPWNDYIYNAQKLFYERFNKEMHYDIGHTTYNMNKFICQLTWKLFESDLEPTLKYKFRNPDNVNFGILCQIVGIYFNFFYPETNFKYIFVRNLDERQIQDIIKIKPKFIIMNELFDIHKKAWEKFQTKYLTYFPNQYELLFNKLKKTKFY